MAGKPSASGHGPLPLLASTRMSSLFLSAASLRVYLFIGLCLVLNFLFPLGTRDEIYDIPKEGDITKKAIIAPFTFDILKTSDEIEKEQKEAMQKVLPVVEYNYEVTGKVIAKFRQFFRKTALLKDPASPDSLKKAVYAELKRDVSVNTIDEFARNEAGAADVLAVVDDILNRGIAATLIVKDDRELSDFKTRYNAEFVNTLTSRSDYVTLMRDGKEQTLMVRDLLTKEETIEREKARLRRLFGKAMLGPVFELIYAYTAPNVFYLEDETAGRRELAKNGVLRTRGKVVKDLEIVGKNKLVTPEIHRNIYSLKMAQDRLRDSEKSSDLYPLLARAFLVALIVLFLFLYLRTFQPRRFQNFRKLAALCIIVLIPFALFALTWQIINQVLVPLDWGYDVELRYLYPVVLGPMLATVLFNLELGCVVNLALGFLLSVLLGFDFKVVMVHLFAGFTAAAGVRNIRYRSQFFLAFLLYAAAYFLLINMVGLLKHNGIEPGIGMRNFGLAALSGALSLMLTLTLLWLFEKLFGLTTNLTLIELSDMNSPVLKKLSMEAPGTYHHSVLVGNLAESAAERVGANPLLTRVIAYYHDIGKTHKPEYFIENNQNLNDNLHEKISPRMSAIIISSHVKQGLELAKKYKLPPVIQDVIREHHGTTLISFFYDKAKDLEPDKNILRADFCYPGPKPRSKETALIMLADSVEAASRTLSDPTVSRLKGLVHDIIEGKIRDGQLDACDLTFIDLDEIRECFLPVLTAMFHTRIEYPENAEARRLERPVVRKTIKFSLPE